MPRWFPSLTRASSPGGNSARSLSRWVALEPAVSLTGIYYVGALRAAEEIARSVEGAVRVNNDLQVQPSS